MLKPEWVDFSPREIYFKVLDEQKKIIASSSTFYRIAKDEDLLSNRVKVGQKRPLNRETPHLIATGPNQVWSWDVTQIKSSSRNIRYYLYVIIDIWSRFVVGWLLEDHEKTDCAIELWRHALEAQHITGKNLVNHKDNGAIMTAKEMVKFVKDVEMIDSYSRAGVSDDNPFSESLFRTIKYFRSYPTLFDSIEEGDDYFSRYFLDYNFEYRHSGIQFITPAQRHYGEEKRIMDNRNKILSEFYLQNPRKFSNPHKIFTPIAEVKIN